MNDTCVVITGLLKNEFISHILDMYKHIPNKIISTWKDQPQSLITGSAISKRPGFIEVSARRACILIKTGTF